MSSLAIAQPAAVVRPGTCNPTKSGHFPSVSSLNSLFLQPFPTESKGLYLPTNASEKNDIVIDNKFSEEKFSALQKPNNLQDIEPSNINAAEALINLVLSATNSPDATTYPSFTPELSTKQAPAVSSMVQTLESSSSTTSLGDWFPDVNPDNTITENRVSSDLSPYAHVWVPTSRTKVRNLDILYPPGKNSEGKGYTISDEAWVALEFGDKTSKEFELPGVAKPDLENIFELPEAKVSLSDDSIFVDRILPPSFTNTHEDEAFPATYFINLHYKVKNSGTYNFAGARESLPHSKLNVDLFRHLLADYNDIEICQFLEFGFPVGLAQEVFLEPAHKNHQSSYCFYNFIDKFLHKEVSKNGVTGPLPRPPFHPTMISPMMTSP